MKRLWDKGAPLDERVLRFTAGEDHSLDDRLVRYDVRASIAHAEMLHACGLLSQADLVAIREGLEAIGAAHARGEWSVTLELEDGQTALAFVWDVYDSTKQRAQRVQGESIGKRSGGSDPWAGIDQTIVAKAASDSMDAIAGFLVTAPGVETLSVDDKPAKPAKPGTRVAATDDKKKS